MGGFWCFGILAMYCQAVHTPATQGATFCQIAAPIYWSVGDSRKTKEQVDSHNRKWKRLCQKKK